MHSYGPRSSFLLSAPRFLDRVWFMPELSWSAFKTLWINFEAADGEYEDDPPPKKESDAKGNTVAPEPQDMTRGGKKADETRAAGPAADSVQAVYVRVRKVIEATCDASNIGALFNIVAEAPQGGGVITPDQFETFVASMVKVYPGGYPQFSPEDLKTTFTFVDTDGNGTLDGDEFTAWFATNECADARTGTKRKKAGTKKKKAKSKEATRKKSTGRGNAFKQMDANKDGALVYEEFFDACKDDGSEEDIKALFDLLDTNKNGQIDRDEFSKNLRKNAEVKVLAKKFPKLAKLVSKSRRGSVTAEGIAVAAAEAEGSVAGASVAGDSVAGASVAVEAV